MTSRDILANHIQQQRTLTNAGRPEYVQVLEGILRA